jgi:hypothetical protein
MVFTTAGGGATQESAAYEISNSLRFNDGDSPKLAFTPSSAVVSERQTFTVSCWVKRGIISTVQYLWEMGGNDNANDRFFARFDASDKLKISDSGTIYRETNRLFRDPSAWYHIVVAVDTTDGTADNRVKVYVNGVQETSFSTSNNPGQNDQKGFSDDSEHTIGRTGVDNGFSFDGYMADFYAVGGSQLAPTSFGETNDNGVWIPKRFSGSYGTNGFKLEFKQTGTGTDASGMGADTSGNDNHFAVTNLTATDVTTDTPTNNFCTWNSLQERPTEGIATFAEGNTKVSGTSKHGYATIALPTSGKWYAEVKFTAGSSTAHLGLRDVDDYTVDGNTDRLLFRNDGDYDEGDHLNTVSYGDSWTNSIISIAVNLDDNEVVFYKDGTAQNSGTAISHDASNQFIHVGTAGGYSAEANFGNAPFTISSGNSDANGYGNFEYAVPSGYYALCTKNLAEYG